MRQFIPLFLVFSTVCACATADNAGSTADAVPRPTVSADAPIPDAPIPDASIPDAPIPDAPVPDSRPIDAPPIDAVPIDAGVDACVATGVEVCNGLDDDCNGQIDEGFPNVGMDCTVGVGACQRGGKTICTLGGDSTTCSAVPGQPAAHELCGNGIDDNCNGLIDEGFADIGTACTVGKGICLATGSLVCSPDKLSLVCDATPGTPAADELCGNGLDDNCDGQVDEGFPDLGAACTSGLGICMASGTMICSKDKRTTVCSAVPGTPAAQELCGNGLDDNCDGQVDEGFPDVGKSCTNGVGACKRTGKSVCSPDGKGTICDAVPGTPSSELCGDAIDNNCDGRVDEGFPNFGQSCTVGVGACQKTGTYVCSEDKLTTTCSATAGTPTTELCGDNIDNNCDGKVDEGFPNFGQSCTVGVGACQKTGTYICTDDKLGTMCSVTAGTPTAELCGDNIDNNCDGKVDEGFPSLGQSCSVGVGACQKTGTYICSTDKLSTVCSVSAGTPSAELCGDGIDNNCDGTVDEGFANLGQSCSVGVGACLRTGTLMCSPDKLSMVCSATPGTPGPELCGDGVDNNCDGHVDEGFALGGSCTVGVGGCARTGTTICSADKLSTTCSVSPGTPSTELCGDGIDNNCDGRVDEGFTLGGSCTVGIGGCARTGTTVCSADKLSTTCSATAGTPSTELCGDGIDNNCNGVIDEGFSNLGTSCTAGVGACLQSGTYICSADKKTTVCSVSGGTPGPELCGDGIDNNCNGQVDEGFPTLGNPCTAGVGACLQSGTVVCSGDRKAAVCSVSGGTPGPAELCGDNVDNNCNGTVDEGFTNIGMLCYSGVGACQASGHWTCSIDKKSSFCDALPHTPTAEICDGIDNNCDGNVDESFPEKDRACGAGTYTGLTDNCPNGKTTCSGGRLACTDTVANNINTDPSNCGACMHQCANPHGSLGCANGTCAPTCSTDWQECLRNGETATQGCVDTRNTNPVCSGGQNLGSISGDEDEDEIHITGGYSEYWAYFHLNEDNDFPEYLSVEMLLTAPANVNLQICSYCWGSACGNFGLGHCANTGYGGQAAVYLGRDDNYSSEDGHYIMVAVNYVSEASQTACGTWSMDIYGNVETTDRTCNASTHTRPISSLTPEWPGAGDSSFAAEALDVSTKHISDQRSTSEHSQKRPPILIPDER